MTTTTGLTGTVSGRYINRLSATLLTIIKAMEGIVIASIIWYLVSSLLSLVQSMPDETVSIGEAINRLFDEIAHNFDSLKQYASFSPELSSSIAQSTMMIIIEIVSLIVLLLCPIIEAIAIVTLRVAKRGAAAIMAIHWIHMIYSLVSLVYSLYTLVLMITNPTFKPLFSLSGGKPGAGEIIATIVVILSMLLVFCYHKDIIRAMKTVRYEIKTGTLDSSFKRTHLSGISFFFWIPFAIFSLLIILLLLNRDAKLEISDLPIIAFSALMILNNMKFLAVSFCYRNLKKEH